MVYPDNGAPRVPVHVLPGHATLGTPSRAWSGYRCEQWQRGRLRKCAMGSIMALRNSQMVPQVSSGPTIWLLAPTLAACCKNQLVPKALEYLHLSNPLNILSGLVPLP